MKLCLRVLVLSALAVASPWVVAASAFTKSAVRLRAGPSDAYPMVATVPSASAVTLYGCLDDWTWCDVGWRGNRGWIYSKHLLYNYQSGRVPILDFGPKLGLTVEPFSLSDYWGRHYVDRPWYGQRDEWLHRPEPPHQPGAAGQPRPPREPAPTHPLESSGPAAPPGHAPSGPPGSPGPREHSPPRPPGSPGREPVPPGQSEPPHPPEPPRYSS